MRLSEETDFPNLFGDGTFAWKSKKYSSCRRASSHAILPLLSMEDLLLMTCTSKAMYKSAKGAVRKWMLKDASMDPYAKALCARVQAHTGLPIYFSIDRYREVQKSIKHVGALGTWHPYHSIITIFGGVLTLSGGLSFRFQSCEDLI